jgi:hypothetical protein
MLIIIIILLLVIILSMPKATKKLGKVPASSIPGAEPYSPLVCRLFLIFLATAGVVLAWLIWLIIHAL